MIGTIVVLAIVIIPFALYIHHDYRYYMRMVKFDELEDQECYYQKGR